MHICNREILKLLAELLARGVPGTNFEALHAPGLSQAGLIMATACKCNRVQLMVALA